MPAGGGVMMEQILLQSRLNDGRLPPGYTECDHFSRQRQRSKQVEIGKRTEGYANYIQLIPRHARIPGVHLDTPPVSPSRNQCVSKRDFERELREWRKFLHSFDDILVGEQQLCNPHDTGANCLGEAPGDGPPPLLGSGAFGAPAAVLGMGGGGAFPPGACGMQMPPAHGQFWGRCVSTAGSHNIREAPSFDSPVQGVIPQGMQLLVVEILFYDNGQWWGKVETVQGATLGWALVRDDGEDYIRFIQDPGARPLQPPPPPPPPSVPAPSMGDAAAHLQALLLMQAGDAQPGLSVPPPPPPPPSAAAPCMPYGNAFRQAQEWGLPPPHPAADADSPDADAQVLALLAHLEIIGLGPGAQPTPAPSAGGTPGEGEAAFDTDFPACGGGGPAPRRPLVSGCAGAVCRAAPGGHQRANPELRCGLRTGPGAGGPERGAAAAAPALQRRLPRPVPAPGAGPCRYLPSPAAPRPRRAHLCGRAGG